MNPRLGIHGLLAIALASYLGLVGGRAEAQTGRAAAGASASAGAGETAQADASAAFKPQARGLIHEAFAEAITLDPQAGLTVSAKPPAPLNEVAPGIKPKGANVAWLPGYWGWDDDRQDYTWVSGVWRVPPPASRWIPGYWTNVDEGYQWSPGFWSPNASAELRYRTAPPASREAGPSSPAPSPNHFYIPGAWIWKSGQYAWRPGYWAKGREGWSWVAAHYNWTPSGVVYNPGYWDYPLANRGLLFAPVAVDASARTNATFTPSVAVNAATLTRNLFVRPGYQHYYFGDYYADNYAQDGWTPWYALAESNLGYDPIYAYDRWYYGRDNPNWDADLRADYQARFDDPSLRPSQSLADIQADTTASAAAPLLVPLNRMVALSASPLDLVLVNQNTRLRAQALTQHLNLLARQRLKIESGALGALGGDRSGPLSLNLPRLPASVGRIFGANGGGVDRLLPGVLGRGDRGGLTPPRGGLLPDTGLPPLLPGGDGGSLLPDLP